MPGLDALWRDVTFASRLLARSPGFTAAATLALALAIGANVTVFTLANAFLFKNLPFDDSDRIVYVSSRLPQRTSTRPVSYPDYLDFRGQVKAFESAGVLSGFTADVSDGRGLPERYRATSISAGAFTTIGQRPAHGREFLPEDEMPGAPPVAIVTDALWRGRYAGDAAIVGRAVRINDVSTTIVGVMRPGVTFPGTTDVWVPLVRDRSSLRRDARSLTMFARLAPGSSLRAARAETAVVASRLAAAYPATNRDVGAVVQNFNDRFNSNDTARLLYWLLWAVVFVLLIACANIGNLLLARAIVRTREMSIRTSLGASRWQVIRQLLVESLLLAVLGGAAGAALGIWGVRVFDAALVPAVKPAYVDFTIDARVIVYLSGATLAAGILFGLAPALQLSRLDLTTALKEAGSVAGQSRRARVLSTLLVVTEVALAVVLLAAAGVMMRSLVNTTRADIGVNPANVLSMSVNLRRTKYPRDEDRMHFYERLKSRLDALPGVETMAVTSDLPAESPDEFAYEVEGAAPSDERTRPRTQGLVVGEDYFRAIGLRPRHGREFTSADTASAPPLAVVNESFVKAAWRGEDAVGKRFRLLEPADGAPRGAPLVPGAWLTVTGVVPDVLQDDERFEVSPVIYLPYRQRLQTGMELMVRTRVPPRTVGESIRREVQALDEDLAVRGMRPLEESLWLRNWRYRVFGSMFAIFAGIALVLASVGLYAVMAHAVSQRTREIGVRRSLGASSATIASLIVGQAIVRVGIGLAVGLAGAFASTTVLESMLVGVSSADPMTFTIVTMVLVLSAALGCAVPARRAMRVDPLVALRAE